MFTTIPIWEVDHYIDDGYSIALIDLRDRRSFAMGHIKGAVNFPFEERENWYCKLPRDRILIFYCSRGGQSMQICRDLEPLGYHVINVANGMAYYTGKYLVRG
jgi:rhodanese-related sulfurtransferase